MSVSTRLSYGEHHTLELVCRLLKGVGWALKMDRQDVEDFVSDKISAAVSSSQNTLLSELTRLISAEVKKISDNQKSLSELQLNKIASISSSDYKFKRKSNEEQFKVNKKVMEKIDDCDRSLKESEIQQAKENLAEGRDLLFYLILRILSLRKY